MNADSAFAATHVEPFYRPFALGAVRTYQSFLSRGRVSTCPMTPSCLEEDIS